MITNNKNRGSVLLSTSALAILLVLTLILLSSCAPGQKAVFGKAIGDTCTTLMDCDESESCVNSVCVASFTVTSEGISDEGVISSNNVCSIRGGGRSSPQLTFSNIPEGTESIIVSIRDSDALASDSGYGTVIPVAQRPGYGDMPTVHWWFYIPVSVGTTELTISGNTPLPAGSLIGQNSIYDISTDFNSAHAYAPFCPPEDEAHEYEIVALAHSTTLPSGTSLRRDNVFYGAGGSLLSNEVLSSFSNSYLDSALLIGYYPCNPLDGSRCDANVKYNAGRQCNVDADCWSGYCKNIDDEGIGNCYAACGDGYQESQEACDDGNRNDGDGCSADCQLETGYTCTWVAPGGCSGILCTDPSLGLSGSSLTTCQADSCSRDFTSYVDCADQRACEALNVGQLEPITIWCDDRCRPRAVVPYVTEFGMVVGSTLSIAQECAEAAPRSTCDNNILDGDETDVDCGGSCPACTMIARCGDGQPDPGETCSSCPADVVCAAGQSCQAGQCVVVSANPTITIGADTDPRIDIIPSGTSVLVQADDVTILEAPATTNLGSVTVTTGVAAGGGSVVVVAGLGGVDHFVYVPNTLNSGVFTCPAGTTIAGTISTCTGVIIYSYADCVAGTAGCSIVASQYRVQSAGSSHGENPVLLGSSCTSDAQCSSYDCINSKCTDVLNQIEIVLQNDQNRTQKIIALATILRSYFNLGY